MKKILKCRISDDKNLKSVLNLGNQVLTGVFPTNKFEKVTSGPLELVWSAKSQLLQLAHSFDLDEMYGDNYGYRSGLNRSMVKHLTKKINYLEEKFDLKYNDIVIDIGSNDATSLNAYKSKGLKKIGVDPSGLKFKHFYKNDTVLIPKFFPNDELNKYLVDKKAKLITSIAMFYDLEDPISFACAIFDALDENGIWHFEQSYMPLMIKNNAYDTICHEHLEFYSLQNIKYILDQADLKIIDVELNNVNGGSFAVTASRKSSKLECNDLIIQGLLEEEINSGFNTLKPFQDFQKRVFEHRDSLRSLINSLKEEGKSILGYGASTKGNVLLQFCGFNESDLKAIAEVNEDKFRCYTPGSNIPIVSEVDAIKMNPDYFLVLPWHFKEEIIKREQEFLSKGGKLIFPLPEIEIVGG
jgi:hypothetical protein